MFITRHAKLWTTVELTSSARFCLFQPQCSLHSKSPMNEPSSCKTSKMQTCFCMFSHVSSSCLWRTLSHTCILYKGLCFCVHYCTKYRVQYLYFKLRISGSKHKSSGDITGSTVLFKVLYHKIKIFLFFVFIF